MLFRRIGHTPYTNANIHWQSRTARFAININKNNNFWTTDTSAFRCVMFVEVRTFRQTLGCVETPHSLRHTILPFNRGIFFSPRISAYQFVSVQGLVLLWIQQKTINGSAVMKPLSFFFAVRRLRTRAIGTRSISTWNWSWSRHTLSTPLNWYANMSL